MSTTRDTHKVLERGLRSLAIRRVDNNSAGDATSADGTSSSNSNGEDNDISNSSSKAGADGNSGNDAVEWLHDFDYVIMDVGRVPHTQDLGLEEVGVLIGEQHKQLSGLCLQGV